MIPVRDKKVVSRWYGKKMIMPRFQLKFSLGVFALLTLAVLLIWGMGSRYVAHLESAGMIGRADVQSYRDIVTTVVVRSAVLVLIFAFGAAVAFSHLIAGPVYRMERTLDRMREGDISMRFKIRPYDELQELAQALDGAVSGMRGKLTVERDLARALMETLSLLAAEAEVKGQADWAGRLRRVVAEFQDRPALFKLDPENPPPR
jgi:methyl-accepting chemotaxis protein